jgi:ABC-2 type transport system ATP-binding protein
MNPIDVKNVSKDVRDFFGRKKRILHDVTFEVKPGVTALVGNNGAGKSTTLKVVLDFIRATTGSVTLFGVDSAKQTARAGVAYLSEQPILTPELTPKEHLVLHSRLLGVTPDLTLLQKLGVDIYQDVICSTLSKGNQTRTGFALALIGSPKLMVLDEPMSGLDPAGRALVRDVIREKAAAGTSVFFSSHSLPDVVGLCERLVILRKGQCVFSGNMAELDTHKESDVIVFARGHGPLSLPHDKRADGVALTVAMTSLEVTLSELKKQSYQVTSVDSQMKLEDSIYQLLGE